MNYIKASNTAMKTVLTAMGCTLRPQVKQYTVIGYDDFPKVIGESAILEVLNWKLCTGASNKDFTRLVKAVRQARGLRLINMSYETSFCNAEVGHTEGARSTMTIGVDSYEVDLF